MHGLAVNTRDSVCRAKGTVDRKRLPRTCLLRSINPCLPVLAGPQSLFFFRICRRVRASGKPACNAGAQQYTGLVTEEVSFFVLCKPSVVCFLFFSRLLACRAYVPFQTSAAVPAFFDIVMFYTDGLTFYLSEIQSPRTKLLCDWTISWQYSGSIGHRGNKTRKSCQHTEQ